MMNGKKTKFSIQSSDLSLRSAAASNLRAMFPYVSRLDFDEQTERMWTIDTHFVPLTLRVLKNNNEVGKLENPTFSIDFPLILLLLFFFKFQFEFSRAFFTEISRTLFGTFRIH